MQRADPLAFRQAASRFATGVAVLTALDPRGEVCGMTANSFVTISLSPPTVLVSVKPGKTHDAMSASGRYGVNVLPEQARGVVATFRGPAAPGISRLRNRGRPAATVELRRVFRLRGDADDRRQRPHPVHRRSIGVRLLRQSPAGVLLQPVPSGPGETRRPLSGQAQISSGPYGIPRVKRRKPGEPVIASNAGSRFSSAKAKPAFA